MVSAADSFVACRSKTEAQSSSNRRHVVQPLIILTILNDHRLEWHEIEGSCQVWLEDRCQVWTLTVLVAIRQALYLLTVVLCTIFNPGFLFMDLYNDVDTKSSGLPICAMWLLAPGTFVARALLSTVWIRCCKKGNDQKDGLSPKADHVGVLLDLSGLMALGAALGEGSLTLGVSTGFVCGRK